MDSFVSQRGMTLVEVMIATVILALVMLGVFAVASHTQRTTLRLNEKTQAAWLGNNIAAEIRAGLHGKITPTGSFQGRQTLGNHSWFWQAKASAVGEGEVIELLITVHEDQNKPEMLKIKTAVWSDE